MTQDEVLVSMAAALDEFVCPEGYRKALVIVAPDDPSNMLVVGNVSEDLLRRGFELLANDTEKGRGLVNRTEFTRTRKDLD